MSAHRVYLTPAFRCEGGNWRGHGKALMTYRGEQIGESREPLFDAARFLLDRSLADPDDMIETWRDGACSMRGQVGVAAKLTIKEGARPRLAPWQPFCRRPIGTQGDENLAPATPAHADSKNAPSIVPVRHGGALELNC